MKLVTFSHLHRTAPDRIEGRDTHVGVYLQGDMPRILNVEAAHDWLNKKRGGTSSARHSIGVRRFRASASEIVFTCGAACAFSTASYSAR